MAGDHGALTCSHLQSYDPDRALTDYISRLEALQRRLGSVTSGKHDSLTVDMIVGQGTARFTGHGLFYKPHPIIIHCFQLYSLCRCFFICSIALWLEKIGAVKLALA